MRTWKYVAFLVLPLIAALALGCQPQDQQAPKQEDAGKLSALEAKVSALETKLAGLEGELKAYRAMADKAAAAPAPAAVPARVAKKETAKPVVRKVERPKPERKQPAAAVKVQGLPTVPKGLNGCPSKGPDNPRVTMVEFTDFQ